jgi:chemotaxis protein methyltransferase WspC
MNFEPAIELLKKRIGLNPESLGSTLLPAAIRERMRCLGLADAGLYARRLESDAAEFGTLADAAVVEESWFFRGGGVFDHLALRLAAERLSFRVLSLPCCTGEEPYSLAIALIERGVPSERWRIDGVDLSGRLVARAIAGLFSEFSFRQTPADIRARYFRKEGDSWRIDERVRLTVRFRTGNAIDPGLLPDVPPYDAIFCRNVLIYLTVEARRQVVANLDRLLAPDGVVCMGHAEPLDGPRFEPLEPRGFFLFGRRRAAASISPRPTVPRSIVARRPSAITRASTPIRPAAETPGAPHRLEVARQHADRGDYRAAKDLCQQLEATGEASAEVYHLMGVIALAQGDGAAADLFRKALYLRPDHREALTHLMHYHRGRGEARQAALYERRLRQADEGGGS